MGSDQPITSASQSLERCPMRPDYNPFAPEAIAEPIATVARCREETPVFYSPNCGWWTVSRYEDVSEVLLDTGRFSSVESISAPDVPTELRDLAPDGDPAGHPGLINVDPPQHRRIRALSGKAFTPSVVKSRIPQIEKLVGELLDALAPAGEGDIVAQFAVPLPILVVSEILGVPPEDADRGHAWSNASVELRSGPMDEDRRVAVWRQLGEWSAYLDDLIAKRRKAPRDDLVSRLIGATEAGEAMLNDTEVRSVVAHLIVAGNETTRYLVASLALRMAEDPGLADQLRADTTLIEPVVEEELRYTSPARGLFRVATEDVELDGAHILKGDLILVDFGGANHDADVFNRPERFDFGRPPSERHLAFGRGVHFCIGAHLARVEAQIALRELLYRLPNLRRANDEPLHWIPSPIIRGLGRLDLRWDA